MVWKVHVTYGAPRTRVVWDNMFYRTKLMVNGEEVKPGDEVSINILAEPEISLSLVAENVGDTGMCWVVIGLESREKIVPLFLKQDILKPGDIIVGKVEYTIDMDFIDYVERTVGSRDAFSIVGYTGHGDLLTELSVYGIDLPLAYVIDVSAGRVFQASDIDDVFKIIETIVLSRGVPRIFPIQPIEIPQFKIKIRAADSGFDFYHLYRYYGGSFRRSGVDLPISKDISSFLRTRSDDSTEVV